MRTGVPPLGTPYPLGTLMPAVYQDDPFAMRWTSGLDDVLASLISTIDCIEAYLDPRLAPMDFLEWLAGWVGIAVQHDWPLDRARTAVARAVDLHRMRGTVVGLRAYVEVLTGGAVDIADNGGATWASAPGSALPGEDTPRLAVRVTVPDPDSIDLDALDALVAAAKPAHVVHRVEVARP